MEEPIYVTQSFLPPYEEYTELLKKIMGKIIKVQL